MFSKILVPLDGSSRAEAILPYVEEIAALNEATVILLEVVEPIPVIIDAHESMLTLQMDEIKAREAEAREYLSARVGEFRSKGIRTQMRIMRGAVAEAICQQAGTDDVDLIAMASHGRGGLGRMVYGSVANSVLHKAHTPMLIVRAEGE